MALNFVISFFSLLKSLFGLLKSLFSLLKFLFRCSISLPDPLIC